ncbi:uncharacterized protein LOC120843088 [Ixodes scapularis]|uniref:uncharacterized protein LOC120843088 n=1 Tax=Ixodes scapularis TaxID=6945 RepID=UPI001A9FCC19|nr:uncharacterized protein LOC120843088 [Ixodes scapularis]
MALLVQQKRCTARSKMASSMESARRRPRAPYLTDEEIQALLQESDADLTDSEDTDAVANGVDGRGDTEPESDDSDDSQDDQSDQRPPAMTPPRWRSKAFSGITIREEEEIPSSQARQEPDTPLKYFLRYFQEDFWEELAYQTNLYSVQEKGGRLIQTDSRELKMFVGIHIAMGVLKLPRVRLYWSQALGVDLIAQAMSRNRFFELRSNIHFVDKVSVTTKQKEENRLFLVEPIVNSFRNACLELPRSRELSIDEQMIPFSGRCPVRQCVPSKPNPVGLKNFIMASPDGLVLDFAIYVGKGTVSDDDMREFGPGGSVVKKLLETLRRDRETFVFTDMYFTGLKIAEHLIEKKCFYDRHSDGQPYSWHCRDNAA